MAVLDGSDRSMDWGRRVRRTLLVAAYDTLGLDDAEFAARIEAPARLIKPASWWIDQRDSEPTDLEELLNDAACNYAGTATQSPHRSPGTPLANNSSSAAWRMRASCSGVTRISRR
jgi:hypothetical protein